MSGELPWFRVYHRMVDDEKLRLLAFEDRWHFVAICCLKAAGILDGGKGELRNRRIAVKLGVQVRELDEIGRRLREVDLVDDLLNPVAWDELQYRSDNSTNRVRKFREKQQCNKLKRFRNVSVTAQETDTETEKEGLPNGNCATAVAPPAFSNQVLVDSWNELAEAKGLPTVAKLNAARTRAIAVRRREFPAIADWQRALKCIADNAWMHGENDRGWRADFDFLLQPKSFIKLVEGSYDRAK